MGDGLAAALARPPSSRGLRVALDGASTVPLAVRRAPDEGQIGALQRSGAAMVGELRRQRLMGPVGLGDDHQPGRILVQPVHDAGALDTADPGKARAAMRDQRVYQCAGSWPAAGCTTRPFGLLMTMRSSSS